MVDTRDTKTIDMFPVERAQAVFQEWMRPFVDEQCSQCEHADQVSSVRWQ
jgi:hypothetical protein